MRRRNKIIIVVLSVFVLLVVFFAVQDHGHIIQDLTHSVSSSKDRFIQSKTLIDSDNVTVIQTGQRFTVNDLLGEQTYFLHIVRVKNEGNQSPKTLIETNTIKIRALPGCGIEIISGGKVYQITPKRGISDNGKEGIRRKAT